MSDESVPGWNAVIHKNVRTSGGMPAENIVAIDEEGIHIESAGDSVHAVIPKSIVSGINNAEVTLSKPFAELSQYISLREFQKFAKDK
jgi:hypothetical protein